MRLQMKNNNRNTKHTPGPWKVESHPNRQFPTCLEMEIWNQNTHVATIQGHHEYKDDVNNEANARLIAAAPELLEALLRVQGNNKLMNALNSQDRETLEKIQSAIAKATGGAE